MPINKDRTGDVPLDEETLQRAEAMCSGLSLSLSIERRGQTLLQEGMLDDLSMDRRPTRVTVAEVPGEPQLTLISSEALGSAEHAMLIVNSAVGQQSRLIGRHSSSRPGRRATDGPDTQVTAFSVERERV